MQLLLERLAALINVKTIVMLIVTATYATLALRGTVSVESVVNITAIVVAFYYGTQHEKQNPQP